MSLTPRLLVRPRREIFESRTYYLLRLAQSNYLSGLPELASVVGSTPSELASLTDEALGQYLRGIDVGLLAPPVYRSTEELELVRRRLWSRCRICPLCIRQKKPSPLYFDFCLSLRCDEHQVFLADRCCSCASELSYLRKRSFHCDCGQALANLPVVKVDCALDLFESQFAPWRESIGWFLDEQVILQREIAAARALRSLLDIVIDQRNSKRRSVPWVSLEDWPVIKNILSPWPSSLLDSVIASEVTIDAQSFGLLVANLEMSGVPALLKLKDKLNEHRKQETQATVIDSELMVPLSRVRQIAKLDAAATKALFQSTFFTNKAQLDGPSGPLYWVSKDEAEKLLAWFNTTVDIQRAAEIIGCPATSVRGLVRMGRLEASYLPTKPRSPRFLRSSIDALIQSINCLVGNASSIPQDLVPLANLPAAGPKCKWWNPGWALLIERVLAGIVPIFRLGNERGWAGIGVSPNDLRACNLMVR